MDIRKLIKKILTEGEYDLDPKYFLQGSYHKDFPDFMDPMFNQSLKGHSYPPTLGTIRDQVPLNEKDSPEQNDNKEIRYRCAIVSINSEPYMFVCNVNGNITDAQLISDRENVYKDLKPTQIALAWVKFMDGTKPCTIEYVEDARWQDIFLKITDITRTTVFDEDNKEKTIDQLREDGELAVTLEELFDDKSIF